MWKRWMESMAVIVQDKQIYWVEQPIAERWIDTVDIRSPNSQMSLEHPYGVSLSCKNLFPPPQSTSVLPSPRKRINSE